MIEESLTVVCATKDSGICLRIVPAVRWWEGENKQKKVNKYYAYDIPLNLCDVKIGVCLILKRKSNTVFNPRYKVPLTCHYQSFDFSQLMRENHQEPVSGQSASLST